MLLDQVMNVDFGHVNSNFSISEARTLLNSLAADYRVIISDDEKNEYYLDKVSSMLEAMKGLRGTTKIKNLLEFEHLISIPAFSAYEEIENVPNKAIVINEGNVIGYFDITSQPVTMTRSVTRGGTTRSATRGGGSFTRGINTIPMPGAEKSSPPDTGVSTTQPFFINAHYRNIVGRNDTVSIRVNLSKTAAGSAAIPAMLAIGSNVDLVIEPKSGFEVIGKDYFVIAVPDQEESESVNFRLRPTQLGDGKVRLMAFVDGIEIGHIDMEIKISEESSDAMGEKKQAEVSSLSKSALPDLTLQINVSENNGKYSLLYKLTSSESSGLNLYLRPYGPIQLELQPGEYFKRMFDEIEKLPKTSPPQEVLKRLERKGMQLFSELFTEELRTLIWTVRDKIKTLKIDSDEPWIPWEICRLYGREGNRIVEGQFFCEAFEVTRWIPGHGAPKSKISFDKTALVVPIDSGLTFTQSEKKYLEEEISKKFKIERIPAKYLQLSDALATGEYTAWHFSGHGLFADVGNPTQSKMILEDKKEFTPEAINGTVQNMGITRPIVFFNACQIGNSAMGLTGVGGWASKLLNVGAAVFIGAYWSISDGMAYEFAKSIYDQLLAGKAMGAAVKEARKVIKKPGDPTWLAYTVYSDPYASIASS